MGKTGRILSLLTIILAGIAACTPERPREEATVDEPLPDTFPVPAMGTDLPEGMLLPPTPDDTAPPPRR